MSFIKLLIFSELIFNVDFNENFYGMPIGGLTLKLTHNTRVADTAGSDPGFNIWSDPGFNIWSDPGFNIWSDPGPYFERVLIRILISNPIFVGGVLVGYGSSFLKIWSDSDPVFKI